MAALGRILQIVGWLWLIGGFFGSLFGFITLSLLPGIILVFVARVIRKQAERTEMPELGEGSGGKQEEARQTVDVRRRQPTEQSPEPYVPEIPARAEPAREPETKPSPPPRRIFDDQAGTRGEEEADGQATAMSPGETSAAESKRPMSSAEMIARAHERWDSKKRGH